MDLGVWLRKLGLAQYEAIFRENAIDADVLHDLTEDHLSEMGLPLGARLKLLKAISALAPGAERVGPTPHIASASEPADAAERRQVTVMFSDLVGSTALSARMDPEDLREVIAAYHECVAEVMRRYNGFVAQYLGDGVLVYFGYPQAHEHDAERAVRAGLELIAAVVALKTRVALQTRIGIATGLVVVGDLMDSGNATERGIVGETPNLAARLQGIAEPNMVVIAEGTRKLLGNLFELEDLGAREHKGIAGPARAWAALRASSVESRFEALHASELTALVGREEESELLMRRWARAKTGEGQVVLLSGEAGIGKSRLTAALLERLATEPHTRLRYFCSPQHTDSAFYPIIGQLERAAKLARDDTPQAKLDEFDTLLAQSSTSPQDAALLAELLSLANDGRYPALDLDPQQRRQKTLEALDSQLQALSRLNPVLMIFEDAHWTDSTSLEVFDRAVSRIATLRVLLIVTFRPEFEPPWVGRPHVTALTVNRLAEREVRAMIDCVVRNKRVPAGIREDIIERTDGIPLFVEEMTKAVLEAESEDAAEGAVAAVPSPAPAVPASLHASLMARLDRLGAAKEVAKVGAAIGREFSYALLASVMRQPEPELGSALDRLIAAGLLFRQGVPPHATYLFKHALVQDAAYGTLLREPRRALHARVAAALEREFADISEVQPELLARHCTEAGEIEKAADLWSKAGQRSLERSALIEAAEKLARALSLMATLPGTPELRREQIKLQVALITPLMQVKGHAAPETIAAAEKAQLLIEQAEAIGEPSEGPLLLFSVLYGFWAASHAAFKGDVMCALAAQFLGLAEKQKTIVPIMVGHRLMGSSLTLTGDIAEGRAHYDQAIALHDPDAHGSLTTRFGQDIGVSNLAFRSLALFLVGYPASARRDNDEAVKRARQIGHGSTLILGLVYTTLLGLLSRDFRATSSAVDEMEVLVEETGALFWRVIAKLSRGGALALNDQSSKAVPILSANFATYRSTGAKMWVPFWLVNLARAQAAIIQFDAAWHSIADAIETLQATGERWIEAWVYQTAGEIALMESTPDFVKAQNHLTRAIVTAQAQQSKTWELRAAMSLARLWRSQGKVQQARELLAPVYGWFTEGFDTRDLKDAKALLEELAP
jgi:class 3 adenylate cyclase/predicted ATPase